MNSANILSLLEKDGEWFSAEVPDNLKEKIVLNIEKRIRKSFFMLACLKIISVSSLCIIAGMMIFLIAIQVRPTKVVFVYPNSGVEKSVNLVGTINKEKKRIPLTLDSDKKLWKATIRATVNDLQDYNFVVEDIQEEDVNNN